MDAPLFDGGLLQVGGRALGPLLALLVLPLIRTWLHRSDERMAAFFKGIDDRFGALALQLSRQDGQLEALARTARQQDLKLIEQDIRIRMFEAENAQLRSHIADLGGFLQGIGYKKRESQT